MKPLQTSLALGPLGGRIGSCPRPSYERRRPEDTVLHKVLRENVMTFLEQAKDHSTGQGLPAYVKEELLAFLDCGLLQKGFLRIGCQDCKHERLVAFSCKKRGFCPSCLGKRQAITTEFLIDDLLPRVGIRQYVISFPFPLRFLLAAQPKVLTDMLGIVNRSVASLVKSKAVATHQNLAGCEIHTGAVSFIQRWGSSLNLNCHLHLLVPEGVWTLENEDKQNPVTNFHTAAAPTNEDIALLCETIATRCMRYLQRKGLVAEEHPGLGDFEDPTPLSTIQAASIKSLIATGSRSGQRVRKIGTVPGFNSNLEIKGPRCAALSGFSIHANTFCNANESYKLRKLISYVSRPPLAHSRIGLQNSGDILYKLKSPFSDGTTHVLFSPIEFIEKLAALVPKPRAHLIRYAGVFSRHSNMRKFVVPHEIRARQVLTLPLGDKQEDSQVKTIPNPKAISWAKLLKRTFDIDLSRCQICQGDNIKVIAAILEKQAIEKILSHLNLPTQAPKIQPARPPPQACFDW